MSRTFDTLGSDTMDVIFNNLNFQAYGNRRGRSSSLFRDYADRDLGSSCSAHAWSLVNYVKFPVEQILASSWGSALRAVPRLHGPP